jgi:hypothetical protein
VAHYYGCLVNCVNLLKELPNSGSINLGERAHILPHSKNGPRGNGKSEGDNTYENLILLCGYHHAEIDAAPEDYPRNVLEIIKKKHENSVRMAIDKNVSDQKIWDILELLKCNNAPNVIPVLLAGSGSHKSFSAIVPNCMQKLLGGRFGYHTVYINLKNIGTQRAECITLELEPIDKTIPKNYTFSADNHITKNTTPNSIKKIISCGPFNVGELKRDVSHFYINYRNSSTRDLSESVLSDIEFNYYLTCDDNEPSSGIIKFAN